MRNKGEEVVQLPLYEADNNDRVSSRSVIIMIIVFKKYIKKSNSNNMINRDKQIHKYYAGRSRPHSTQTAGS